MTQKSRKRYIDRASRRLRKKRRKGYEFAWMESMAYWTGKQHLDVDNLTPPANEGYFVDDTVKPMSIEIGP